MAQIVIRDFEKPSDYDACARLQMEVWGFDAADAVPPLHLIAMHHFGGVLVGAFDADRMVGFVCGFCGIFHGKLFHHSHMLAVVPDYRGSGLGEKLKWAQRDRVLEQGISLINWTFDPLQAVNAKLNIHRLGGLVRKYRVNLYGESASPLHGRMPTDRFEVEWLLTSERVTRAKQGEVPDWADWESLPLANPSEGASSSLPRSPEEPDLSLEADAFLIRIPDSINDVMAQDPSLALDWRLKTRALFQNYFEKGYAVMGFHRSEAGAFYRLEPEAFPSD